VALRVSAPRFPCLLVIDDITICSSVMDVPLLLDHAFDFFAVEPVQRLAEALDNQNGWIEWDVLLGGEMDELMENPGTDPADLIAWSMLQNQQLQTRLSEMENCESTLISFMCWMEDHLVVLEKRLMGPPTRPQ
nr:hypothetical protein [Tanacetum cinerariifolium]